MSEDCPHGSFSASAGCPDCRIERHIEAIDRYLEGVTPMSKPVPRSTAAERKALPLATGVLDYFPDALLVVAEVSRIGNEQHHPGKPLHWDKSKSTDEADALMRHLVDRGKRDTDGVRHTAKVAWRALALLQRELDAEAADSIDISDIIEAWVPSSLSQSITACSFCGVTHGEHVLSCPKWSGYVPRDGLGRKP